MSEVVEDEVTYGFKKTFPHDLPVPSRTTSGSLGLDICSAEDFTSIRPGEHRLIKTGWSVKLPPHTGLLVTPRSGLAYKYGVTVLNSPGLIDNDYEGEIGVILINHGAKEFVIEKGMRIAQLIPIPTVKFDFENKLCDIVRGTGGFGSTGLSSIGK